MSDLHERLRAAITERMDLAKAATPGPWFWAGEYPQSVGPQLVVERALTDDVPESDVWLISTTLTHQPAADAQFVATNDPATVLRHCAEDLDVLDRHRPGIEMPSGRKLCSPHSGPNAPYADECLDIQSLARRYNLKAT